MRHGEIIVDSFAGGGGASLGIEMALGRGPDVAINHDAEAIAMHARNHPHARHYREDVWKVDPVEACGGRPVGLMWASPDCKHFSKAKGGKPVEKKVRGLAWVVVRWAAAVRPRVIALENVEEFQTWGPIVDGRPCPDRRGDTFRRWVGKLRALGYVVEWREMRACDYGAPTSRKRLFVIARCDGEPVVWPRPTHGAGRAFPWRTAADCIDWALPCPSIFERARPLADATCRRIARGIVRYVIEAPRPFIAPTEAMIAPTLVQTGYGEREGQAPRSLDLHTPLGTVVSGGQKHALVAAFLAKHYGERATGGWNGGSSLFAPTSSVTTRDHHALVTSHLVHLKGTCADGKPLEVPMPTVMAGAQHIGEIRSFLTKYYGTGDGQPLTLPLGTVTTRDRFGLVMVDGEAYEIADIGMRMLSPRELARAQGFPDRYVLEQGADGKPLSKTAQVRMVGNSVCPPMAAAIVRANVGSGDALQVAA